MINEFIDMLVDCVLNEPEEARVFIESLPPDQIELLLLLIRIRVEQINSKIDRMKEQLNEVDFDIWEVELRD